jgi:phosphatidylethanolamine/phosphatidyl-N-methylethanolamine N-methyltransferase
LIFKVLLNIFTSAVTYRVYNMKASSEKFYDRITTLYPVIDFFLKPQKHKLFEIINEAPPGRLLEIGVGDGAHFKLYSNHEVTGIDSSRAMLRRAQHRAQQNIALFHMSAENLLFDSNAFDYVVLSHVVAVVDDPERMLMEVHRVLKPNGKVFILNHFTPANWLQYIDKAVALVARSLHVRSVFYTSTLKALEKFKLHSELDAGVFSYFKILTYEKNT